ncbi:homogentisate 1,2-dioxygenase [Flavisphingomonas formosensis]|uniref:homogentisate 1,2-dioxygenase n=1 Tax=Flavisphingomonas formosensis TaxID=861534 RepID=UPI001E2D908F|nr:homogentisate 1,2-dioxygenase [Sphingomonas formosensis]
MNGHLAVILAALMLPAAAMAQETPEARPDCSTARPAFPAALAGWSSPSPLAAAARSSDLGKATIVPGNAFTVALRSTGDVRYAIRPEKPGGSVSYGGMLRFTIAEAGTYRIALGSGAWVDVVRDGTSVQSTAHGHGPICTGIRKMVDFSLTPGRYILQIAANGAPSLALMLARLP